MRVLVTGATGFVGLNVVHALLERGASVVMFAPALPQALTGLDWLGSAQFVTGDVRCDADVQRAFAAGSITHLIHAAALTPDSETEARHATSIAAVNLEGTLRIVQAACDAGLSRAVVLSSGAVYGNATGPLPLDEDSPAIPVSLYGITKQAAERAALRLSKLRGLETVSVRLAACFGRYEYRTGDRSLMSPHWQAVEAALQGATCRLPRPMASDWIDAKEAGRALADLALAPAPAHNLFCLGGGGVTTLADWCVAISTLIPFRWNIDPEAPTIRAIAKHERPGMAMSRLRGAIGWVPDSIDLAAKAAAYLKWRRSPEGQTLVGPIGEGGDRWSVWPTRS